jgi:hypothetical protein
MRQWKSLLLFGCSITFMTGCTETAPTPPEAKVEVKYTPAPTEPAVAKNVASAPVAPAAQPAPPAKPREAEVLLSSRDKSQQLLIIALDFAGTPAMDKSRGLDERRQYVTEHVARLYRQDFAKQEKPGQKVKVFALGVPNRDDYLRGDFRNTDELAICETTHDQLLDDARTAAERLGTIDWRAALK